MILKLLGRRERERGGGGGRRERGGGAYCSWRALSGTGGKLYHLDNTAQRHSRHFKKVVGWTLVQAQALTPTLSSSLRSHSARPADVRPRPVPPTSQLAAAPESGSVQRKLLSVETDSPAASERLPPGARSGSGRDLNSNQPMKWRDQTEVYLFVSGLKLQFQFYSLGVCL